MPNMSQSASSDIAASWPVFAAAARQCVACELSASRQRVVLGQGAQQPHWLILTPAPSQAEEHADAPLIAEAAHLYAQMLLACGLSSEQVFTTPSLKCHPPAAISEESQSACRNLLQQQIQLLQPQLLVIFGLAHAANFLRTAPSAAEQLRGHVHLEPESQLPIIVTHHPLELLVQPALKREAWQDLQLAMRYSGLMQ